jgi:hypothetical protein
MSRLASILKNRRLWLAAPIALAFALRAMFLVRHGSEWILNNDSKYYLALARGLTHWCGFAPFDLRCGSPDVLRTPGYPLFLVPFGSHYRSVILAQSAIGALTCMVVSRFVTKKHSATAAVIAAAFVAIDIPTILVTKEIMSEPLFQCLAAVAILSAIENEILPCAAFLGASMFVRPVGLVLVPICVLAFLSRRRWQGGLAVFGISLALVLGWVWRNEASAGIFAFTVEGAGNLYWFTAPAVIARHDGTPLRVVQGSFEREEAALGSGDLQTNFWGAVATPAGSQFMLSRALRVILEHPFDTAAITLQGFVQLAFEPYVLETGWQGFIKDQSTFNVVKFASTVFQWFTLSLLWTGVIIGLARAPNDKGRWLLLGAAVLLLLAASPFAGNINTRFRTPAVPFLAALAGMGLSPRSKAGDAISEAHQKR